uniref:Zinc finger protein 865 n=1 Tax=Anopheles darlingi TaxID=43151 RepID=A0A2M4CRC1_ANODA
MDLIEVCRVCMKQEKIYWSLFSNCNVLPEGFTAAYLITECVGVSVEPNDGLPEILCKFCLQALICAHNIRQTCFASDRKLRKNLEELSTLKHDKTDILATAVALVEQDEHLETVTVEHFTSPMIIEQEEQHEQQEEHEEQEEQVVEEVEEVEEEEQEQQDEQEEQEEQEVQDEQEEQEEQHIPEECGAELQVDEEQYVGAESLDELVEEGDDIICSKNGKLLMEEVEFHEMEYFEETLEPENTVGMKVEIVDDTIASSNVTDHRSYSKVGSSSHKDSYTCEVCLKTFSTKGNLKSHLILHTNQRPFACELCGVKFAKKGNYKVHLARHSSVRSVKCPSCDKSFVHEINLRNHMRKHTGEKPFACQYCPKKFAYLSDKKRHEVRHTGIYPFHCVNCEKNFIRKQSYLVHINKCYDGTISLVESVEGHSSDDSQPSVGH